MTKKRILFYMVSFVLIIAAIIWKIDVLKRKAKKEAVSIDSEWQKYGIHTDE